MKTPQEIFENEVTKLKKQVIEETGSSPNVDKDGIIRIYDNKNNLRYEEKPNEYAQYFATNENDWNFKWTLQNGECHRTSDEYGFGRVSYYPNGIKRVYNEFSGKEWLSQEEFGHITTRFDEDGVVLTKTTEKEDGSKVTTDAEGNILFSTDKNNNLKAIGNELEKYDEDYLLDAWTDLGIKHDFARTGDAVLKILTVPDRLQLKMDMLRQKLGDKLGKTGTYSKEEAKTHINTAKEMMQMKHQKRGGMGE